MSGRPILIEAAINEGVTRAQHPFVPVTPAECASDAIGSVAAGASFAHWHAANLAAYAQAWGAMRAADILAYPTYPNDPPADVEARLGHCFALIEHHGLEMAPLDLGTAPTIFFDGERITGGGTLANPLAFIERAADRYRALGAIPNLASFDLGHTRLAVALARTGVLKPPLLLKLYLSDAWLVGPRPGREALDLHLAQLPPDLEIHWLVVPFMLKSHSSYETLCRHALDQGGGFRVGIGDNPGLFPGQRNPELVERAVRWVEASGRRVAGTQEVRALFGPGPRVPRA
jgi:3-keto-5-aminohexanoate cleavage enzyme